ncbi:MAG: RecB family exonuclease [Vampirovibrionales bacterium]
MSLLAPRSALQASLRVRLLAQPRTWILCSTPAEAEALKQWALVADAPFPCHAWHASHASHSSPTEALQLAPHDVLQHSVLALEQLAQPWLHQQQQAGSQEQPWWQPWATHWPELALPLVEATPPALLNTGQGVSHGLRTAPLSLVRVWLQGQWPGTEAWASLLSPWQQQSLLSTVEQALEQGLNPQTLRTHMASVYTALTSATAFQQHQPALEAWVHQLIRDCFTQWLHQGIGLPQWPLSLWQASLSFTPPPEQTFHSAWTPERWLLSPSLFRASNPQAEALLRFIHQQHEAGIDAWVLPWPFVWHGGTQALPHVQAEHLPSVEHPEAWLPYLQRVLPSFATVTTHQGSATPLTIAVPNAGSQRAWQEARTSEAPIYGNTTTEQTTLLIYSLQAVCALWRCAITLPTELEATAWLIPTHIDARGLQPHYLPQRSETLSFEALEAVTQWRDCVQAWIPSTFYSVLHLPQQLSNAWQAWSQPLEGHNANAPTPTPLPTTPHAHRFQQAWQALIPTFSTPALLQVAQEVYARVQQAFEELQPLASLLTPIQQQQFIQQRLHELHERAFHRLSNSTSLYRWEHLMGIAATQVAVLPNLHPRAGNLSDLTHTEALSTMGELLTALATLPQAQQVGLWLAPSDTPLWLGVCHNTMLSSLATLHPSLPQHLQTDLQPQWQERLAAWQHSLQHAVAEAPQQALGELATMNTDSPSTPLSGGLDTWLQWRYAPQPLASLHAHTHTHAQADALALPPSPRPLSLSITGFEQYLKCPRKYYYGNRLRPVVEKSAFSLKGRLIHFILEAFYTDVLHHAPEREAKRVQLLEWHTAISQQPERLPAPWQTHEALLAFWELPPLQRQQLAEQAHASLLDFTHTDFFATAWQTVQVEAPFENVSHPAFEGIAWRGSIDFIAQHPQGHWIVADFKTYGASKFAEVKEATVQAKLETVLSLPDELLWQPNGLLDPMAYGSTDPLFQLVLYPLLWQAHLTAHPPIDASQLVIVRPPAPTAKPHERGSRVLQFTAERVAPLLPTWLEQVNRRFIQPLRNDTTFLPNPHPSTCQYCDYTHICEAFGGNHDDPQEE